MAEEGSKKIDENNIEEGGENKNKTVNASFHT